MAGTTDTVVCGLEANTTCHGVFLRSLYSDFASIQDQGIVGIPFDPKVRIFYPSTVLCWSEIDPHVICRIARDVQMSRTRNPVDDFVRHLKAFTDTLSKVVSDGTDFGKYVCSPSFSWEDPAHADNYFLSFPEGLTSDLVRA